MKKIYNDILEKIPDYKAFLTVDEMDESSKQLAQQYPDAVSIFTMGKTKEGHPLYCLKIGNGSKNALMFGCPHPNEPIGSMMLEYFTEQLASSQELRDELDYTWYVVKAWDADGLRLNEKWLKGPYTLYNYSRNFFRPAGHKQVDWTFPIEYKNLKFDKPIPETVAMMELIDEIKPEFIYSLHNAGFGGVYWYITHEIPELYDEIREVANSYGVPLNLGEPESPSCEAYSPAVFKNLGIESEYDYLEKYGIEHPEEEINVGTCSAGYAKSKYDSFTMLTELPYFYDERIKDLSEGTMSRKDAVKEQLKFNHESNDYIRSTLDISQEYFQAENPFYLALKAFTKESTDEATLKMIEENPDFQRIATVAEEFDSLLIAKFYKMLSFGMLIRANELELDLMAKENEVNDVKQVALEKARDIAIVEHKKLTEYLEDKINYDVIPIKKLIGIQLACGLLFADKIHG